MGDFAPPGRFGNVWRDLWLSLALVNRDQGCRLTPCSVQDGPTTKNLLAPNVNSVKGWESLIYTCELSWSITWKELHHFFLLSWLRALKESLWPGLPYVLFWADYLPPHPLSPASVFLTHERNPDKWGPHLIHLLSFIFAQFVAWRLFYLRYKVISHLWHWEKRDNFRMK